MTHHSKVPLALSIVFCFCMPLFSVCHSVEGFARDLTITPTLDSGPIPDPVAKGSEVKWNLTVNDGSPVHETEAIPGDATYAWSITSTQYSADGITYGAPPGDGSVAPHCDHYDIAKPKLYATFKTEGYWRVNLSVTVSYTDTLGTPVTWGGTGTLAVNATVVTLDKIILVSGAEAVAHDTATPASTDICAEKRAPTGDVLLKAKLIPDVPAPNLAITWSHGSAVTGDNLQITVSKSTSAKTEVTATLGSVSYTMLVYIIWADNGDFHGDGGAHFTDFTGHWTSALGAIAPNPTTGKITSRCEIQFLITPAELITDGNARVFAKDDIKFDVSRDKKRKYWKKDPGWVQIPSPVMGGPSAPDSGTWLSDDAHDDEEDNNPWDGSGHVYGQDALSSTPAGISATATGIVVKLNMREWVRVNFHGHAGRDGLICSGYNYWHCFRAIIFAGTWANDATYENEIISGNVFWGTVPAGADITVTTTTLPTTVQNLTGYNQTLASAGGAGALTWSVVDGSLPSGLSLTASAGTVTGTPTSPGTWNFTVQVSDSTAAPNGPYTDLQDLTIVVAPPVSIATTSMPNGVKNLAGYSVTASGSGGNGAKTWSKDSGSLPTGMSLDGTTGVISGTPTASGTFTFVLKLTDSTVAGVGGPASATQSLTIIVAEPVVITNTCPNGTVGVPYSQQMANTGGNGSLTWTLHLGPLPPGLTVNATGLLSGTPTTSGDYTFTIKATDSTPSNAGGPSVGTKVFAIHIP